MPPREPKTRKTTTTTRRRKKKCCDGNGFLPASKSVVCRFGGDAFLFGTAERTTLAMTSPSSSSGGGFFNTTFFFSDDDDGKRTRRRWRRRIRGTKARPRWRKRSIHVRGTMLSENCAVGEIVLIVLRLNQRADKKLRRPDSITAIAQTRHGFNKDSAGKRMILTKEPATA